MSFQHKQKLEKTHPLAQPTDGQKCLCHGVIRTETSPSTDITQLHMFCPHGFDSHGALSPGLLIVFLLRKHECEYHSVSLSL